MTNEIRIRGAKENNLKNIDLNLPRDKIIVFTGVSGSGKSTLAFDTIFAEGQRRYVESLSAYARQFLGQMQKPDVESIEGLSPAVSIDQKTTSANPRSTVGTITEIYDYLRLLYARIGVPYCTKCGKEIERATVDKIVDKILLLGEDKKIIIKAPVVRGQKGAFVKFFDGLRKSGYVRVEVDGNVYMLDEEINLDKNLKHNISVIVDRLVIEQGINKRLTDSVETALKLAEGLVAVSENGGEDMFFNTKYSCIECSVTINEITPRLFSFNSPFGACDKCSGLGMTTEVDLSRLINEEKSITNGAISVLGFSSGGAIADMYYEGLAKKFKFSLDVPFKDLSDKVKHILLYGTNEKFDTHYESNGIRRDYAMSFEGVVNIIARRYKDTTSQFARDEYRKLMKEKLCDKCKGLRLSEEALSVKIGEMNIAAMCELSIDKLKEFLEGLELKGEKKKIAESILKEIFARLKFLSDVGLNYLTLSRQSGTLSGGEAQRIRLATQIGSGLAGVLYILDEPSIGLHQRDNERLLKTLKHLKELGNTLIVVEHDEDTIRMADYVVDIGPKAGVHGGEVVAAGTVENLINEKRSLTGKYLSGERHIKVPEKRRKAENGFLEIKGAKENNLKNINVRIPAKTLTAVTGVSGSGKSSLVNEIIYPELSNRLNRSRLNVGKFDEILGTELFDKCINIDQSPIGRTPRSNSATYTGVWGFIRDIFASTIESKERGYKAGRFSFNVSGGRCEACGGDGLKKIEMYFLPDVYVPCEECHGKRYNRETLEVKYKGKSISEVLDLTCEDALKFFDAIPSVKNKLQTLVDVGLGYIRLGQSATTLSGGEAQRVKLATELSKRSTGKTIYILDEPTTGLHFYDVEKLINILQRLVKSGNTVLVIEHNLDVIKVCDHIIDLGKEGGDAGGEIVCVGTPEEVSENKASHTGRFLKKILNNNE